jgi:hypothetical protein
MTATLTTNLLYGLWNAAREEANLAYEVWCETGGVDAFVVYRAAEDRADAAQRELSEAAQLELSEAAQPERSEAAQPVALAA